MKKRNYLLISALACLLSACAFSEENMENQPQSNLETEKPTTTDEQGLSASQDENEGTYSDIESRKIAVSETVSFDGFEAKIQEIELYPDSFVIKMSDVDAEEWARIFLVEDPEAGGERIAPKSSLYDEETETFELLYSFEDGVPETDLILKIKKNDGAKENRYYDYPLKF